MALQHLRSNTASKRPTAGAMSDGQIAINTNATSPGLFFKDAGGSIIKVGPVHVGTTAPNSSPAGSTGNSLGEQWLDTSGGSYVLKIWDGSAWRSEVGEFVDAAGDTMTGALILPNGTAAAPALGVGSTDNGVYSPGTDQVAISTSGVGRVFVDASGNVGLGSSSPSVFGSSSSLVVQKNGSGESAAVNILGSSTGNSLIRFADGTATASERNAGSIAVNHNDGSMQFGLQDTERLRITSAGLVGIGTSSPQTQLHVNGGYDGSVTNRLTFSTTFDGNANSGSGIYFKNYYNNARITAFSNPASGQGGTLQLQTYNSDVSLNTGIVLDSGGRVGIGTTPEEILHIKGPSEAVNTRDGVMLQHSTAAPTADTGLPIVWSGYGSASFTNYTFASICGRKENGTDANYSGYLQFATGDSSGSVTEKARIDSSGRLLVGTSTSTGSNNWTGLVVRSLTGFTDPGEISLRNGYNVPGIINGNDIGSVLFQGSGGETFGSIKCTADAAPGTNDYPGRLVFSVTADGASSPTEAMRIKNSRILNFANTPVYTDNAAAKTGGLVDGDVYRKSDGTLMIVYT